MQGMGFYKCSQLRKERPTDLLEYDILESIVQADAATGPSSSDGRVFHQVFAGLIATIKCLLWG